MQEYNERYEGGAGQGSTANALHAVKKPPPKPWRRPAAPQAPPKVYRVEPRGFRQLVQSLTAAPPARRLQDAAPPPLTLRAAAAAPPLPPAPAEQSPTSPYQGFFSLPLLSPGSIAFLDDTKVS
ncbi:VQ motif-containing protein [Wolffia australiana]